MRTITELGRDTALRARVAAAPGAYQLLSERVYGSVVPHTTEPRVGDRVQRILAVECDSMNELYRMEHTLGAGNDCRRLVPRKLDVLEVSGWTGPGIPDSRDQVSYSANGSELTLIFLHAYRDHSRQDLGIRCPATPPSTGDPCSPDPAPLECEYGGDSFHNCTTYAACVMDLDGAFHFSVDPPGPCTPPNPPACPRTFLEARTLAVELSTSDGGAADAGAAPYGLKCQYAEGICGCTSPHFSRCTWSCRGGAELDDGGTDSDCPMPRPLAGDPCSPGQECSYARGCGDQTSLGPSMICQNGYWENRGDVWFSCPAAN